MTQWFAGNIITAAKLNDGPPSTLYTTGLVLSSGWTLNDFRAYRSGRTVSIDMYVHRSGANIVPSDSNIVPDVAVATVPAELRPTNLLTVGIWDTSSEFGGWALDTNGLATLRTGSATIEGDATSAGTGRNLRMHMTFIIDN